MIVDKLKDCPFCGCEAHDMFNVEAGFLVECMNPNCFASVGPCDNRTLAIQTWNKRVDNLDLSEGGR